MKINILHIVLIAASVLAGCQEKEPVQPSGDHNGERIPISWMATVENLDTKALVGSSTGGDFVSIQYACDETGSIRNSIGFWTDMIYRDEQGREQHRYDVFNTNGKETKLVYNPDYAAGHNGAWTYWEDQYSEPQYWSNEASYNFVAYYPQTMSEHVLDAASSTSVNTFVLTYNTHIVQEDLMVAYNSVHTSDPVKQGIPTIYRGKDDASSDNTYNIDGGVYGYKTEFQLENNIPLHFMHTLAAIRIQFKFNYPDEDELIECWLENSGESGIHTVGTLVFGIGSRQKEKESDAYKGYSDNEKIIFEHKEKDDFSWVSYLTDFGETKLYNWSVKSTVGATGTTTWEAGLPLRYNSDSDYITAIAYTKGTDLKLTEESKKFTGHNGWITLIPQKSPGTVKLNYRLASSTNEYTTITIPANTRTDKDGYTKGETRPDGTVVTENDCVYFAPGHLYTYTVLIDKSISYINIQTAPWEEIFSSTEIIF